MRSHSKLYTDAAKLAVGACLMQRDDSSIAHTVAYYSRKLKGAQACYSAKDNKL